MDVGSSQSLSHISMCRVSCNASHLIEMLRVIAVNNCELAQPHELANRRGQPHEVKTRKMEYCGAVIRATRGSSFNAQLPCVSDDKHAIAVMAGINTNTQTHTPIHTQKHT